jgi:SOS-response transcriptional repressor LexA
MPDRPRLTDRQREIFEWISARSMPPTYREIGAAFGIKSPQGVECHIRALEKKGYLTIDHFKARGLRVVGANDDLLDLLRIFRAELASVAPSFMRPRPCGWRESITARIDRQIDRLEKGRR